jgi:YVTN family beta-propeller protein
MPLVANNKPAVIEQPTDRSLDLPATFISAKGPSILSRGPFASSSMRTDQFDAPLGQSFPQRVAVGGSIIDQSFGTLAQNPLFQERFNQLDFQGVFTLQARAVAVQEMIGNDHSTIKTVSLKGTATHVAMNQTTNKIYVTNHHENRVTVIDGSDHSSVEVSVWKRPMAVAVNSRTNTIYVANMVDCTVIVIQHGAASAK